MLCLPESLKAWGRAEFTGTLKQEIEQSGGELPLQQCLTSGSVALDHRLEAMILGVSEDAACIRAKVGIFYSSVTAGCSCADDPTPVEEQNEYCEMWLDINKVTAETKITLSA